MAKRSAIKLFDSYYTALVFLLPIKDIDFIDELVKHDLLPGELKIKLEQLTSHDERSSYFLDNVIKPGLVVDNIRCFVSLLTVMKCNKQDNVKELAKKLEKELVLDDIKCKTLISFTCKVVNFTPCVVIINRSIKAIIKGFVQYCYS